VPDLGRETAVQEALLPHDPDPDLLEYVLVAAGNIDALAPLAAVIDDLERAGVVRLLDAVTLVRTAASTTVDARPAGEHEFLKRLDRRASDPGVRLSPHDIQLASVTVDPAACALLLLLQDTWALPLAESAREHGARIAGGERIAPHRARTAALAASGATDLVVRGPVVTPLIDQVAQVRQLAHLVERGLLPLEGYEVQRRRVLGA